MKAKSKPEYCGELPLESANGKSLETPQPKNVSRRMLREWLRAKAALGHYDRAGWVQDLCLYWDPQWNLATGECGPARWFISPPRSYRRNPLSGQPIPFDCREIPMPADWSIYDAEEAIRAAGIRINCGVHPGLARHFPFRTGDVSGKRRRRDRKAHAQFGYPDRTARTGKITACEGLRFQPAGFVWANP